MLTGAGQQGQTFLSTLVSGDFANILGTNGWNISANVNPDFVFTGKLYCTNWFMNTGNYPVKCRVFLVTPRVDMFSSGATTNYNTPGVAFSYGFFDQATPNDANHTYYQTPGVTPYESVSYCKYWKILKTWQFTLGPNIIGANSTKGCDHIRTIRVKRRIDVELGSLNQANQLSRRNFALHYHIISMGAPIWNNTAGQITLAPSNIACMQHCLYKLFNTSDQVTDKQNSYNVTSGMTANNPNFPWATSGTNAKSWLVSASAVNITNPS